VSAGYQIQGGSGEGDSGLPTATPQENDATALSLRACIRAYPTQPETERFFTLVPSRVCC
jgi:hypothetical protein